MEDSASDYTVAVSIMFEAQRELLGMVADLALLVDRVWEACG